jgi:hypothetical protein
MDEDRFASIGWSFRQRLIVVPHSERGGRIRIISARLATPSERMAYERAT